MEIKISVVIPVYNAEEYIIECIESLLGQTLKECEFIFVNDGSNDDSQQIIERYKLLDSRIKLINQENQGVSCARNNGLKIALGEYIGFVDADDFIEEEMYKVLYDSIKSDNSDSVISNISREERGEEYITRYPFPVGVVQKREFIEQEILPYLLKADNLNPTVNKLYKRQVMVENQIKFPEGIELGEDGMFNIRFFSVAETIKYIDFTGYHYREVTGSATRDLVNKDYFKRAIDVYNMKLPHLIEGIIAPERIQILKSIKLINSVMAYIHVYFMPTKEISFFYRYKYIEKMIFNKYVGAALDVFYRESYQQLGRYERLILQMMKQRTLFGLYVTTAYSRYRNK